MSTNTPERKPSRRAILKTLATASVATNTSLLSGQASPTTLSGKLPRITVHKDGHFLQTETGQPFFWLGDTAWELIHHTTREEASYYLHTRARQRFTVILSEFEGITTPSALGIKPFLDPQYRQPNPAYFQRIVELVEEAASLGLYVALVVTWGDKLTAPWGAGPRLFTTGNLPDARNFAKYVGTLLRDHTNVLWMLGGDRPARLDSSTGESMKAHASSAGFPPGQDWTPVWGQIAAGLADGLLRTPLIVYHPQGGELSSSVQLPHEPWLSVHGMQSGHGAGHDVQVWRWIARDYAMTPPKPTLDLEPNYEDHPVSPWPTWNPGMGYFRDYDVRKQTYRSVFAGACGVTYGHHAVWGFINARNQPITFSDMDWIAGVQRPGGQQMQFLRNLIESRPFFRRVPDQSMIAGDAGEGGLHAVATRDVKGTFAFVYIPVADRVVRLRTNMLTGEQARIWWYNPQAGIATPGEPVTVRGEHEFRSPSYGPDWVLVLDTNPETLPPGLL